MKNRKNFDANVKSLISEGHDYLDAISKAIEMESKDSDIKPELKGADENGNVVKTFKIESKNVDEENRTVEGYISTWDLDEVDDVIHSGAFDKTIKERFPAGKIKMLWQHEEPLGMPLEMSTDAKGVFVKAKISKTRLGDEALELAADGVVDSFSIGFRIPKGKAEIDDQDVRHIYEVKLHEFSLVTFPANEAAVLTGVSKSSYNDENEESGEPLTDSGEPAEAEDEPQDEKEYSDILHSLKQFSDFARNYK